MPTHQRERPRIGRVVEGDGFERHERNVAEACGEPLATIYRLFADREGLIAAALLRAYVAGAR